MTHDVELRGVVVRRHDLVVAMVDAANRDRVFPRPDEFGICRTDNRHLAFGHGTHFCLGRRWRGSKPRSHCRVSFAGSPT